MSEENGEFGSPKEETTKPQEVIIRPNGEPYKYQPNPLVLKLMKEADEDLRKLGVIVPSEKKITKGIEAAEDWANGNHPEQALGNPEYTISELYNIPVVAESAISAIMLTINPVPEHTRLRLMQNPGSEPTSEELIEIYQGIKKRIDTDPTVAKFEDLAHIIKAEIFETERACLNPEVSENPAENYMDPYSRKLNFLSNCEDALKKISKKERVTAASPEGQSLVQYLSEKIAHFEERKLRYKDNPEMEALTDAAGAFFGALYNRLPA